MSTDIWVILGINPVCNIKMKDPTNYILHEQKALQKTFKTL